MYDWSEITVTAIAAEEFQLLLKGCTIEALTLPALISTWWFQLLLKGCTIEAYAQQQRKHSSDSFSCCWKDVRLKHSAASVPLLKIVVSVVVERMYDWSQATVDGLKETFFTFQLLLKGCTIEAPKPTDWKQMIFDSWFLICFSKMVDLHKKCHYFRKFGVIWVIAWLFLIVVVTSSYILSTTKSP